MLLPDLVDDVSIPDVGMVADHAGGGDQHHNQGDQPYLARRFRRSGGSGGSGDPGGEGASREY